jgi:hypothetical protein
MVQVSTLKKKMSEIKSLSTSEVSITMSGQDRGKGVTDLSIKEANK